MYDNDFRRRVNGRQVTQFFLTGAERLDNADGTPQERYAQYENGLHNAVESFFDEAIKGDWSALSSDERKRKIETISRGIYIQCDNQCNLAFEMGYYAGLRSGIEAKGCEGDQD